ncbi:MAG TPA: OsmC family protein [Vicinamibacterales bacterium]|nr:OsmC family protein [Vicinamibacterales bacterium]
MHKYEARVSWSRGTGEKFTDNRYSRAHEWAFDGGLAVKASSSPSVVPLPLSAADAIDPEEALVASVSSCHMLYFLFFAAKRGFVVDSYVDSALGELAKGENGKQLISRITLRPRIVIGGEKRPSPDDLASLHHAAHEECFIANSLKSEIVVEPVLE